MTAGFAYGSQDSWTSASFVGSRDGDSAER